MRIGQLNAAALSLPGLSEIDPAFNVFEIPLFYESHEEVLDILERMTPVLRERLEERGFVLLHWGHAGWVRMFSTEPVSGPDDLRRLKVFVWGEERQKFSVWRANGFEPVALSANDIPTGLQTGLINAVPAPPLSALALQWYRQTPYMMDLEILPLIGATVVSEKTWRKISEEDRQHVLAAAHSVEERLLVEVPEQERLAIDEMRERGLTLVAPAEEGAVWNPLAEEFAEKLRAAEVPEEIFEQVSRLRDRYRGL